MFSKNVDVSISPVASLCLADLAGEMGPLDLRARLTVCHRDLCHKIRVTETQAIALHKLGVLKK